MIKIKNWEDLDDVGNDNYYVRYFNGIRIYDPVGYKCHRDAYIVSLDVGNIPPSISLSILKSFDFDIEFQEEPTLTDREFYILDSLKFTEDKLIRKYLDTPYLSSKNKEYESLSFKQDLFQFIKASESWEVEDLLKLKRKGE
jgi:hypothetical protein